MRMNLLMLSSIVTVNAIPQRGGGGGHGGSGGGGGGGQHQYNGNEGQGSWGQWSKSSTTTSAVASPDSSPIETAPAVDTAVAPPYESAVPVANSQAQANTIAPVDTALPATSQAAVAGNNYGGGAQTYGGPRTRTRGGGGGGGGGGGQYTGRPGGGGGQTIVPSSQAPTYGGGESQAPSYPVETSQAPPVTQPGASQSTYIPPASTSTAGGGGGSPPGASACPAGQQQIVIENKSGTTLYVVSGGAFTVGTCGSIAPDATCLACQASGSGGNLQVSTVAGGGTCGTWIEANSVDAKKPCADVSIIPGYAVPILCTGSDGTQTGFANSICKDGDCPTSCNSNGGTWSDATQSCQNPTGACINNKPPDFSDLPFFEAVGSSAYYFPYQGETTRPGVTQTIQLGYSMGWWNMKCVAYPQ